MKRSHAGWAVWAVCVLLVQAGPVTAGKGKGVSETDYQTWLKRIRLIEIRCLRSTRPRDFADGREKILAIRDEAAIGPMVDVLYGPKPRNRGLLIEALSHRAADGSKVAEAYLQEVAVGDGSAAHRRRAVDALKTHTGDPPTERLMAHLALDEVPVIRNRAATALAALGEKRAVWLLVERLVTEDVKVTGGEVWSGSLQLDIRAQMAGVPVFRQVVVQAAVPNLGVAEATIQLPQVEVVDVATTVAMTDHHKPIPAYRRVKTKHPQVLAALKKLTGKNFGYNQAAWQKWLERAEANRDIPPWKPIRFKAG